VIFSCLLESSTPEDDSSLETVAVLTLISDWPSVGFGGHSGAATLNYTFTQSFQIPNLTSILCLTASTTTQASTRCADTDHPSSITSLIYQQADKHSTDLLVRPRTATGHIRAPPTTPTSDTTDNTAKMVK